MKWSFQKFYSCVYVDSGPFCMKICISVGHCIESNHFRRRNPVIVYDAGVECRWTLGAEVNPWRAGSSDSATDAGHSQGRCGRQLRTSGRYHCSSQHGPQSRFRPAAWLSSLYRLVYQFVAIMHRVMSSSTVSSVLLICWLKKYCFDWSRWLLLCTVFINRCMLCPKTVQIRSTIEILKFIKNLFS